MSLSNQQFLMSTEIECLTSVPEYPEQTNQAIDRLVEELFQISPAIRGTVGVFTPYGKVYKDCGDGCHLELAAIECDSPYTLAQVVEQQLQLVSRAQSRLREQGVHLLLAGNNHDGLLESGCAVWGAHENYLVEEHPMTFGARILPFLVTRIYGGAGGIHYPSANFLAAVRPIAIEQATGGGTTAHRAIHSTARDENHMGTTSSRYRYHLILGDGHRCQFNLSLQFGATALALKAALFDPELPARLRELGAFQEPEWVALLHECNLLAKPGKHPCVHPLVLETQRIYLESAAKYVDQLHPPHAEARRWLTDWRQTLDALEAMNLPWLSGRLDAFAKFEFYSSVLAEANCGWTDLPQRRDLFQELALLDHSYHEFGNSDSLFCRLDQAGLLDHRVCAPLQPGDEPEPFVPATSTRAAARAKFIRDHARNGEFRMDWAYVANIQEGQVRNLHDPFAADFGDWEAGNDAHIGRRMGRPGSSAVTFLDLYQRGEYSRAARRLDEMPELRHPDVLRHRAWVLARMGQTTADACLQEHYADIPLNLVAVSDYCCVWRFFGLTPDSQIDNWIERGREFLDPFHAAPDDPFGATAYRDHVGYTLLARNDLESAVQVLETASNHRYRPEQLLLQARVLGSLATAFRRLGERPRAEAALHQAKAIQQGCGYMGDLADTTLQEMAKLQTERRAGLEYLRQAESIQTAFGNFMGLVRTWLMQVRLEGESVRTEEKRQLLIQERARIPALVNCPMLAKILDNWDAWVSGDLLNGHSDPYWGL